ncbi:hypothetical protein E2C01_008373 [Portunus trituberculatus]|uniref:Uncharacterized protein n=1 Tax=Portunus trituberculatus TaxID=210409 RepID=A0A5B7D3V1_PORTR|nr:hypothetical protein [Portunus trituberculatus]
MASMTVTRLLSGCSEVAGNTTSRVLTLAWAAVDVDGLGGIVAIIVLNSHQVGVSLRAEVGPQGQHMVIAVAQGLGHLPTQERSQAH